MSVVSKWAGPGEVGTNLPTARFRARVGQLQGVLQVSGNSHQLLHRFQMEGQKMAQKRTAQQVGMLSLPDVLLTEIALKTCKGDDKQLRDWAKATLTCKRLCDLQLCSERTITSIRRWQSETLRGLHSTTCGLNFCMGFMSADTIQKQMRILQTDVIVL